MRNYEKKKRDILYKEIVRKTNCIPLYKTTREVLDKISWFHVNKPAIYISQKSIAKRTHLSLRTVERCFHILYKKNIIHKLSRKSVYKTNVYLLNTDLLDRESSKYHITQNTLCHKGFSKKVAGEMAGNIDRYNKALRDTHDEDHETQTLPSQPQKEDVKKYDSSVKLENSQDHHDIADEMIDTLDQETQGKIKPDPNYRCTQRKLVSYFKTQCEGSLKTWRAFCQRVGSSRYLMGKSNGFIPPLLWLLKDHVKVKMDRGEFHRPLRWFPSSGENRRILPESESRSEEKKACDHGVSKIDFLSFQKNRLRGFSAEKTSHLRQDFESRMKSLDLKAWQEFQYDGWDSYYVKSVFSHFLLRAVA